MNRPWMPWFIAEFVADTAHLDAAETGAYMLLIGHYWLNDGLPDDDKRLARIARMSDRQWAGARATMAGFFQDGWKHKRIEFELTEVARKSASAKEAGVASGRARRQRPLNEQPNGLRTTDERQGNDQPNETPTEGQPLHLDSERKKEKKDAAIAAPGNLESQLFQRGKEVCGKDAGGLIAKLLKAKKNDVALARAAVETASTKQNPREYVGAVIAGGHASADGKRLSNDEEFYGTGRIPGIV